MRPTGMNVAGSGVDARTPLSSLLLLVTQRGAIVGKMQSMLWDLCRFLHVIDGQAFLDQFGLLLWLPVMVEIDSSTGHRIATHSVLVGNDSVLVLLLVKIPTIEFRSMNSLHQSELGDECHTWWRHLHGEAVLRGLSHPSSGLSRPA